MSTVKEGVAAKNPQTSNMSIGFVNARVVKDLIEIITYESNPKPAQDLTNINGLYSTNLGSNNLTYQIHSHPHSSANIFYGNNFYKSGFALVSPKKYQTGLLFDHNGNFKLKIGTHLISSLNHLDNPKYIIVSY